MRGLEWPAVMAAGMRGLGLKPDEFWNMTPAELRMMLGDTAAAGPLLSDRLETLMNAWPDEVKKDQSDDR